MSVSHTPQLSVTYATHGRLRLRILTPRGGGHLDFVAGLLQRLPHVNAVRINHAARSVTLTFDSRHLTGLELVERLSYLGLTIVELSEPAGWGPMVAQRVAPRVANPATLPGRANLKLLAASGGRVNLVRMVAGLLILVAALDGPAALLRGPPLPWARVLIYLSAAASLWARSQALGEYRVPGESKRDHHSQVRDRPRPGLRPPPAARVPCASKKAGEGPTSQVIVAGLSRFY